jgi:hypothetical protein
MRHGLHPHSRHWVCSDQFKITLARAKDECLPASGFAAAATCQRPAGSGARKDGRVEAGGMITGGSAPRDLSSRMDGKVVAGGIGAGGSGGGSGRER